MHLLHQHEPEHVLLVAVMMNADIELSPNRWSRSFFLRFLKKEREANVDGITDLRSYSTAILGRALK